MGGPNRKQQAQPDLTDIPDGRGRVAAQPRGLIVPVLLPYPFPGPFDYRVPPGMAVAPGDLVLVPLNRRIETGVVWDGPPEGGVGDNRLRPIAGPIDAPPMRADLRQLIDWIAAYTVTSPGLVLAMALRVPAAAEPAPVGWRRADPLPAARITPQRQRVLDTLADAQMQGPALARAAEVSPAGASAVRIAAEVAAGTCAVGIRAGESAVAAVRVVAIGAVCAAAAVAAEKLIIHPHPRRRAEHAADHRTHKSATAATSLPHRRATARPAGNRADQPDDDPHDQADDDRRKEPAHSPTRRFRRVCSYRHGRSAGAVTIARV